MKQLRSWLIPAAFIFAILANAARAQQSPPSPRVADLKSADGILLKATYFPAVNPGPGVLLFHQANRTRTSWDALARQLAVAGINTLTVDNRGHGESGGTDDYPQADVEAAFQFLTSQPGVQRDEIGLGGAGSLGVINAIQVAQPHASDIKSFVMISGDSFRPGIEFLHQASQLPELFVIADTDDFPPTVETMLWLYARSSSPMRKLIRYPAAQDAPWLWYETSNPNRVPPTGSHGTDLFMTHPDLPGIVVDWFVTTLIKTPGHAPIDPLAASAILNQLEVPDGVAQVTHELLEARKRDRQAQLWPEVCLDNIGSGHINEADSEEKAGHLPAAVAERKAAIEIFKLNLLAYPDSADAHFNLADAYFQDGQKALARQLAQEALALLDAHKVPLSSWSDTEERRAEIRQGIEGVLKKTAP